MHSLGSFRLGLEGGGEKSPWVISRSHPPLNSKHHGRKFNDTMELPIAIRIRILLPLTASTLRRFLMGALRFETTNPSDRRGGTVLSLCQLEGQPMQLRGDSLTRYRLVIAFLRDETDRVRCGLSKFFCDIEPSVPVKREPYSSSCKVGSTATNTAGVAFDPASYLLSVPPRNPHRLHSGWAYRHRVPSNETHEVNTCSLIDGNP